MCITIIIIVRIVLKNYTKFEFLIDNLLLTTQDDNNITKQMMTNAANTAIIVTTACI